MGMLGEPKFPGITAWIPWKGHSRVVFFPVSRRSEGIRDNSFLLWSPGVGLRALEREKHPKILGIFSLEEQEAEGFEGEGKGQERDSCALKRGTESLGISRWEFPGGKIQVGILWSKRSRKI